MSQNARMAAIANRNELSAVAAAGHGRYFIIGSGAGIGMIGSKVSGYHPN